MKFEIKSYLNLSLEEVILRVSHILRKCKFAVDTPMLVSNSVAHSFPPAVLVFVVECSPR